MEKEEIVRLANKFYEQVKLIDPTIKKIVISFEEDDNKKNIDFKKGMAIQEKVAGGCVYIPGIGVICF